MRVLHRAVLAFLGLKLGVLLVNLALFPVLRRPSARSEATAVSLLVPMRDEADQLGATLPGLLRQDVHEVVLLDDGSTDGTYDTAVALTEGDPRVRVVRGTPPPAGWTGKTWACEQLARLATGELLLFCDADVLLADGAMDAVLAAGRGADLLSVFPRQVTGSLAEHLVVPVIDDVLLCFLPYPLLAAPVPSAATANGSLLLFTRAGYQRVGGFAAVRDRVVEDVALARLARRRGLRLGLALGGDLVSTRMYAGADELAAGLGRGLAEAVGGRARLVPLLGWHVVAYTMPWIVGARHKRWLLPALLGVAERALVEAKTGRGAVRQAWLAPLTPLGAAPVVLRALRRRQSWKGRVYG